MSEIDQLLVSSATKRTLESYLNKPAHTILIVGTEGLGTDVITSLLTRELLKAKSILTLKNSSQIFEVRPNDSNNISINSVREIWQYSRVPASGASSNKKIVVVHRAETMTREAQNSFLKLLEEPPAYMLFVLEVSSDKLLLPTVRSRAQKIVLKPMPEKDVLKLMADKYGADSDDARRAWIMSGSEPYRALQILREGGSDRLSKAKQLLSLDAYSRISENKELLKDRSWALGLSDDIMKISYLALDGAIKSGKNGRRWIKRLKLASMTKENLSANGNVRLNIVRLLSGL